jgi:hypothetical protein
MTREIGREFELPKTLWIVSYALHARVGETNAHSNDKVLLPLIETKAL